MRGKAGKAVEFGAKISASNVNGFVFLDKLSWDSYNESGDLKERIEEYKKETGCYPESVHVDKIYRTRANRVYCEERGIRNKMLNSQASKTSSVDQPSAYWHREYP